jgi:hypothetical protein
VPRILLTIILIIISFSSKAAEPLVSDYAFVMPEYWFVIPGKAVADHVLLFRRYSVAMHKADFDLGKSGKVDRIQIIGNPGQFYNSMIYNCQRHSQTSDFLTLHMPPEISPASFKYDEWIPNMELSILAKNTSSHVVGEYLKGDIFVDANSVGVDNFLRFVSASDMTVQFGEKGDRLNLLITDKFVNMDLADGVRQLLPAVIDVGPKSIHAYTSDEMLKRCLGYKRTGTY